VHTHQRTVEFELSSRAAWIGCAIAGIIVSVVAILTYVFGQSGFSIESYTGIQTEQFLAMNAWFSGWPTFWANITEFGDASLFFAALTFFIFWKPQTWWALICAIPLSSIFSVVGKDFFGMPRPAAVLPHDQFNIVGKTLMGYNSLPSGHTITVFAIITVVASSFLTNQKSRKNVLIIFAALAAAAIAAVSRVAVGAHWPLDVVTGASLGTVGGISGIILSQKYSNFWKRLSTPRAHLIIGVLVFIWGLALAYDAFKNMDEALVLPWVSGCVATLVACRLLLVPRFIGKDTPREA